MIKTKEVVVPARARKITIVEVIACDICGKEGNIRKCVFCKRDVCKKTWVSGDEHCGNDDPENHGDYPDYYCKICYKLKFEEYKAEREQAEQEYYNRLDSIERAVLEESLKVKNHENSSGEN